MFQENITANHSEKIQQYINNSEGKLQAQVSSFAHGLLIFKDIRIIRIQSAGLNLMILEDYMPTLGEVNGTVHLIFKDYYHAFENVKGFFCVQHNVFFMLLDEN